MKFFQKLFRREKSETREALELLSRHLVELCEYIDKQRVKAFSDELSSRERMEQIAVMTKELEDRQAAFEFEKKELYKAKGEVAELRIRLQRICEETLALRGKQ